MIYEPNVTHWLKGQIVIHDSDAKEPKMLMRVVGFTRDGLVKTQYCDRRRRRTIWKSEMRYLHDPRRFQLSPYWGSLEQKALEKVQAEWEHVRRWNQCHQIGDCVITTSADGGFKAVTTSRAEMGGENARIWLNPGGLWLLKFVKPYEPAHDG